MSQGAPVVFAVPSNYSASLGANLETFQFNFVVDPLLTAVVALDNTKLPATAPALAAGPSQLVGIAKRNSIVIFNPADGALVYVGKDNTLTPATGVALGPGYNLGIYGWLGPVWLLGSVSASSLFYRLT